MPFPHFWLCSQTQGTVGISLPSEFSRLCCCGAGVKILAVPPTTLVSSLLLNPRSRRRRETGLGFLGCTTTATAFFMLTSQTGPCLAATESLALENGLVPVTMLTGRKIQWATIGYVCESLRKPLPQWERSKLLNVPWDKRALIGKELTWKAGVLTTCLTISIFPPLSNPNSKYGQLHAMSPKVPCPAPGLRAFVYSPSASDALTYPCSLPGSFSVFRAPLGGHLFQEAFPVPARQRP